MTLSRSTLPLALLLASGCVHTPTPDGTCGRLPTESRCAQKLAEGDCAQARIYCGLEFEFNPNSADTRNAQGLLAERCREVHDDKAFSQQPGHAR